MEKALSNDEVSELFDKFRYGVNLRGSAMWRFVDLKFERFNGTSYAPKTRELEFCDCDRCPQDQEIVDRLLKEIDEAYDKVTEIKKF